MADNTTLPGTGEVVADEDIGGVKYQRTKMVDGAPGGTKGAAVNADAEQSVSLDDAAVSITDALAVLAMALGLASDPASGRLRVTLDNIAAALTLATITTVSTVTTCTTVSTVTNKAQEGGIQSNSLVFDTMMANWSQSVRRCIT